MWETDRQLRAQIPFRRLLTKVQALPLEQHLTDLGLSWERVGHDVRLKCPFHHGHSFTCSVAVAGPRKGYWRCWHPACAVGGLFPKFVALLTGKSPEEVLQFLGLSLDPELPPDHLWEAFMTMTETMATLLPPETSLLGEQKERPLPMAICPPVRVTQRLKAYLHERKFSDPDVVITAFELGECLSGRFRNRMILPCYDALGRKRFFCARALEPEPLVKMLYPTFPVTDFLLGEEQFLDPISRLVLVEGPFDYLKLRFLGFSVMALFGARITERQIATLLQHDVGRIELALDADRPGRHATWEIASRLIAHFQITAVALPEGTDPGDLETAAQFQALPRVSPFSGLAPD